MDRFAATGVEGAVTASLQSCLQLTGAAASRGKMYDFTISQSGTPEDSSVQWTLDRFTVAPVDTLVTPVELDEAGVASAFDAGEDGGTTGTITASTEMFDQDINERAAYRWVAAPDGEIWLAASTNGIVLRVTSGAYAGTANATMHWLE